MNCFCREETLRFEPFGWHHLFVVLASLVAWGLLITWGRKEGSCLRRYEFRLAFSAAILATNVFWFFMRIMPDRWSLDSALPLHLCDFAWMACCWSLVVSDKRLSLAHQLVFYWGLGLSTQAFIQPTLHHGIATLDYWFFWLPHWQIVAVGLLNSISFGMGPTWKGFRRTVMYTVILVLCVTAVNIVLATPYCFTGRGSPENPTVLDFLGPWPWRIFVLFAIVISWFAVLTKLCARRPRRKEG